MRRKRTEGSVKITSESKEEQRTFSEDDKLFEKLKRKLTTK
ncbi:hypothetical protein BCSJ1_20413 [Bacillus cereus SJ1]|nr:hypothetical protein BCSJ1_20413 [Bacillus cereus SJ1]